MFVRMYYFLKSIKVRVYLQCKLILLNKMYFYLLNQKMNDSPCRYCFSIYSCLPNTFLRVFAVIKKIFLLHNLECVLLFYFHFEHIPGLLPFMFNSSTILGISFSSIPPDMAISSES